MTTRHAQTEVRSFMRALSARPALASSIRRGRPQRPLAEPSRTTPQTRAWPLLGMSGDCSLIMPLAGPIATEMGRAVCHERTGWIGTVGRAGRLAAARGAGACRPVQAGVERGGRTPSSRSEVLIAPRGARECPYKAHARILSGSVVPDGLSRGGERVRGPHVPFLRVLARSASRVRLSRTPRPRSRALVT